MRCADLKNKPHLCRVGANMPASPERLLQRLTWDDLDLTHVRRLVEMARDEDLAGLGLRQRPARTGDASTASVAGGPRSGEADLAARQDLVVCCLPMVPALSAYGGRATFQPQAKDGAAAQGRRGAWHVGGRPAHLVVRRAHRPELPAAPLRSGHSDRALCHGARIWPDTAAGHPQNDPWLPHVGKIRSGLRRRLESPPRPVRSRHARRTTTLPCSGPDNRSAGTVWPVRPGADWRRPCAGRDCRLRELPVEVEVDALDQIAAVLAAGADVILLTISLRPN